jgi:hypothetical protein
MDDEMINRCKEALASCFAPAIDFKAPYAKVMLDMGVKEVIKAMREPTSNMEQAGDNLDDWGVPSDPGSGNACALAHWHAMIDAILND